MRTVWRILGWVVGVLILAPIFVVLAAVLLLNIGPGTGGWWSAWQAN